MLIFVFIISNTICFDQNLNYYIYLKIKQFTEIKCNPTVSVSKFPRPF
jgi:hypothetical protein